MRPQSTIRPQSMWMVQQIARDSGVSETAAASALQELIARGHLRIVHGESPADPDAFEPIIKRGRK